MGIRRRDASVQHFALVINLSSHLLFLDQSTSVSEFVLTYKCSDIFAYSVLTIFCIAMSLSIFTTLPPPSLPPLLLPPINTGSTISNSHQHHLHLPNGTLSSSRLLSPPPTPTLSTSSVFRTPPLPKGSPALPQRPLVYHNGSEIGNLSGSNVSHVCVHRLCVRQNGKTDDHAQHHFCVSDDQLL